MGLLKKILVVLGVFCVSVITLSAQENYKGIDSLNVYANKDLYNTQDVVVGEIEVGGKPRNIILLIGDGMGVSQIFAGLTANRGELYLKHFKSIGFSLTSSSDNYITDSAAGGTAIAAGVKTKNGMIGLDADSSEVVSILELAEKCSLSTGLVSTSAITHATPASFIAHQVSRGMYEEIASDFLDVDIDVFIGGGRDFFKSRKDGRDLLEELRANDYFVSDSIVNIPENVQKAAILTAATHNGKVEVRKDMLSKSTDVALRVLEKNEKGFFVMIEGSQIDWGGHKNDIKYVVEEMLDFDKVIGQVLKFAIEDGNTLVVVTADHETGGLSIVGGTSRDGSVSANFGTNKHTAVMVPVFAYGPGEEYFRGVYENNELYTKMVRLLNLQSEKKY